MPRLKVDQGDLGADLGAAFRRVLSGFARANAESTSKTFLGLKSAWTRQARVRHISSTRASIFARSSGCTVAMWR